ncbi:hypothetical protein PR048_007307 [Dryococelus australis]|uniref:Uncharacterized protein n=1 Tax=Dryococelus australis TaxID=614101 RepID=A0ABQ9IDA4_9NEOP|nr:hypothetical protein PR048_007307 [Dryococelus australis]
MTRYLLPYLVLVQASISPGVLAGIPAAMEDSYYTTSIRVLAFGTLGGFFINSFQVVATGAPYVLKLQCDWPGTRAGVEPPTKNRTCPITKPDYSPPTWANRVLFRWGRSRIFTCGDRAGLCRWSAGFLVDLPFPPPLYSGVAPYSPHFTSIGCQHIDVRRPNIFTHCIVLTDTPEYCSGKITLVFCYLFAPCFDVFLRKLTSGRYNCPRVGWKAHELTLDLGVGLEGLTSGFGGGCGIERQHSPKSQENRSKNAPSRRKRMYKMHPSGHSITPQGSMEWKGGRGDRYPKAHRRSVLAAHKKAPLKFTSTFTGNIHPSFSYRDRLQDNHIGFKKHDPTCCPEPLPTLLASPSEFIDMLARLSADRLCQNNRETIICQGIDAFTRNCSANFKHVITLLLPTPGAHHELDTKQARNMLFPTPRAQPSARLRRSNTYAAPDTLLLPLIDHPTSVVLKNPKNKHTLSPNIPCAILAPRTKRSITVHLWGKGAKVGVALRTTNSLSQNTSVGVGECLANNNTAQRYLLGIRVNEQPTAQGVVAESDATLQLTSLFDLQVFTRLRMTKSTFNQHNSEVEARIMHKEKGNNKEKPKQPRIKWKGNKGTRKTRQQQ